MENNKNQAELYREQRKERLAKAAAKSASKSPKAKKAKKIVTKVIAIVLAVVIGLGAIFATLNFFGVPQKAIKITVADQDYKISLAEYGYYYYSISMQYLQTALQYDSYGEGMGLQLTGYDYKKTPANQEYTEDHASKTGISLEDIGNPENPTWEDVFQHVAVMQLIQIKHYAKLAVENNIELTETETKTIDSTIENWEKEAKQNDYSLDRYLHTQIGKGMTEKLFRQMLTDDALANAYITKIQDDTLAAVTEEQINTRYESDKDAFDVVDVRAFVVNEKHVNVTNEATADEKKAEIKAYADKFLAAVTDEASFIAQAKAAILTADNKSEDDGDASTLISKATYASFEETSEELAKWIYDDARKVGDKTVVVDEDGNCHVVLIKALPYKDMTTSSSDVRHILIKFPDKTTDADGKEVALTTAQKNETKAKAQEILDEYLKNPTEENFIELTKKHTADVNEEGKPNNDGLYEKVSDNGQYVANFTNWAIDSTRKPGETGLVESDYGYHIMYYVKANEPTWYETVKNAIYSEELVKKTDDVVNPIVENTKYDSIFVTWETNEQNEKIALIIANNF